jgi:hypothetical protein
MLDYIRVARQARYLSVQVSQRDVMALGIVRPDAL